MANLHHQKVRVKSLILRPKVYIHLGFASNEGPACMHAAGAPHWVAAQAGTEDPACASG